MLWNIKIMEPRFNIGMETSNLQWKDRRRCFKSAVLLRMKDIKESHWNIVADISNIQYMRCQDYQSY